MTVVTVASRVRNERWHWCQTPTVPRRDRFESRCTARLVSDTFADVNASHAVGAATLLGARLVSDTFADVNASHAVGATTLCREDA
jgi:hypothetical protein